MSININEYCVNVELMKNERTQGYESVSRKIGVEKGNVDINKEIEDMIIELENKK